MRNFVPQVRRSSEKLKISGVTPLFNQSYAGLLISHGHRRLSNGQWDGGGPFLCLNRSVKHAYGLVNDRVRAFGSTSYYTNAGCNGTPVYLFPATDKDSLDALMHQATDYSLQGYNNTRPGQSKADALVTTKELLSDGLPSIPLSKLLSVSLRGVVPHLDRTFRAFIALGGEYLNVIFGWKPFVNDLRKLYATLKTIDKQVNQLVAENGHRIRRRSTLMDVSNTTHTNTSNNVPYANVYGNGNPYTSGVSAKEVSTTTAEKVWYSACYKYWIPDPLSWQWRLKAKAILFGAYPTPQNLYAAMPWSWLVDWFTSIGGILQAMSPSAVDNLAQLYGFTMRQKTLTVQATNWTQHPGRDTTAGGSNPNGYLYSAHDFSTSSTYVDSVKSRSGGFNPFGPDKTAGGFTPYQFSVLSALGLTRLG
jgi:hypothetical protein